mmetsp:Transcript_1041/g.2039  ORF Transcript_1041/g.2039 Transcript_1041/m.2039 type:complete len:86 (-) Transcript_1041:476-733(-)
MNKLEGVIHVFPEISRGNVIDGNTHVFELQPAVGRGTDGGLLFEIVRDARLSSSSRVRMCACGKENKFERIWTALEKTRRGSLNS